MAEEQDEGSKTNELAVIASTSTSYDSSDEKWRAIADTYKAKLEGLDEKSKLYQVFLYMLASCEVYTKCMLEEIKNDKYWQEAQRSMELGEVQDEASSYKLRARSGVCAWESLKKKSRKSSNDGNENMNKENEGITLNVDANSIKHNESSSNTTEDLPCMKNPYFDLSLLRPYQLVGFHWLRCTYENGVNTILADEMGLGKTIQVIAIISHLIFMEVNGPFLIVCPLSTINNWLYEFGRFAPQIQVVKYHGEDRQDLLKKFIPKKNDDDSQIYPVVLTNYETINLDVGLLNNVCFKYLVIDEGHKLKNINSKISRTMRLVNREHTVLLTGTPLQNNLLELYSLLNFLVPEVFGDDKVFQEIIDVDDLRTASGTSNIIEKEKSEQVITKFHEILRPFVLRRTKKHVNLSLPPKYEKVLIINLTEEQKRLYSAVLDKTITEQLSKDQRCTPVSSFNETSEVRRSTRKSIKSKSLLNGKTRWKSSKKEDTEKQEEIMQYKSNIKMTHITSMLQKIANHPYLVNLPTNGVDATGKKIYVPEENLVLKSGKMQALELLLPELKKRNHKVLLFSTSFQMLDFLEDYMQLRNYDYCRLDGSRNIEDREENIKKFFQNEDAFVFLISTKAGGLGINLTVADTVILFDSDWNPQVDLQAQDRCHRIGQTRTVMVYRFISKNTIDQRVFEIARAKRKLELLFVESGHFSKFGEEKKAVTVEQLYSLLQSDQKQWSDYGVEFSDDILVDILERAPWHDKYNVLQQQPSEVEEASNQEQMKNNKRQRDEESDKIPTKRKKY